MAACQNVSGRLSRPFRVGSCRTCLSTSRSTKGNSEASLLDTWLQFGAVETLDGILGQLKLTPEMTEDDILAAALKVDTQLIALYEELAGESSVPHVRELFEALAKMQEARERQLARAVQ
jgi:rubrerythrin